jgi:hypothetical protein
MRGMCAHRCRWHLRASARTIALLPQPDQSIVATRGHVASTCVTHTRHTHGQIYGRTCRLHTHIYIYIYSHRHIACTCRTMASAAAASRSAQSARSTSRRFSPAIRSRAACTSPAVTVPQYSRKLRMGSMRRLAWSFARHSPHTLPNVRMRACGEILESQCPRILPAKVTMNGTFQNFCRVGPCAFGAHAVKQRLHDLRARERAPRSCHIAIPVPVQHPLRFEPHKVVFSFIS